MGWVSRFVVLVLLSSMLLEEVGNLCLFGLNCLPSSEITPPVTFLQWGSWLAAATSVFGGVRDLASQVQFSFLMHAMLLSWSLNGASKSKNYLVISHFPRCNNSHVLIHMSLSGFCVREALSCFPYFSFSLAHTHTLMSKLAEDRVQCKNNSWPCLAVLGGIESCFLIKHSS